MPDKELKPKESGFGYYNAKDYEPKPDDTKWIIDSILPKGLGFTAGLPKGSNSPHGGKSVWFKAMSHAIGNKVPFLGFETHETGAVLSVNLDETPDDQILYFRNLCRSLEEAKNFYVSTVTSSLPLPSQFCLLENDIESLRPVVTGIDPLLRCMGGKDVLASKDTAPIIDRLKNGIAKTGTNINMVHHSQKNPERDKESSATWLNGSVDLDSAWDYLHALEWVRGEKDNPLDLGYMHARIFTRKRPMFSVYYEAVKRGFDVIGLRRVPDEIRDSFTARQIYGHMLEFPEDSLYAISKKKNIPKPTILKYVNEKFECLKLLYSVRSQLEPKIDTSCPSQNSEIGHNENA